MGYQDCIAAVQADETDANELGANELGVQEFGAQELGAEAVAVSNLRPSKPQSSNPQSTAILAARLAGANVNLATGFATDYLNHFNEAIMLLEMVANCPDCLADFNNWRRLSYREHFQISAFAGRDLAIAAYEAADPAARAGLDRLAATMTNVIEQTRATMTTGLPPQAVGALAERAAAWLKVLVARAGAIIHGDFNPTQGEAPQTSIDRLMRRPG